MAEEQIHLNQTRLMSLLNIMQHRTRTTQEFLDYALDEVIKLTESKVGYIYLYHGDRHEFVLNTWSKDVMNECKIANPQTCYELEKPGRSSTKEGISGRPCPSHQFHDRTGFQ
jgi:GAF domain-containing protein